MMKKILLVLFLLPSVAFAAERYMPHPNPPPPPEEPPPKPEPAPAPDIDIGVDTTVTTTNTNTNTATGGQGGQATGGAATVSDVAGGSVGDISMVGGGVDIHTPRQVASAYAPSVFPTAICQSGYGVAIQTGKWGVSWTKADAQREACLFALAQQWMAMGEYELSCRALMATNSAIYTHRNDETKPSCVGRRGPVPQGSAQAPQPTIIVLPVGAPGSDFDEKLKRAFEAAMGSPK